MTSGLDVSLISSAKIGLLNQTKQWLDAGADIHANSDEPLRVASLYGNVKVVRLLLDRGANIHALDDYALRYSVQKNSFEMVQLLLDCGANIHADEDSALRDSAYFKQIKMIRFLLDRGANIHAKDDEALRCQFLPTTKSYEYVLNVVQLLLDRGANIHARDDEALRKSVIRGDVQTLRLLLNRGANVHAWDDEALRKSVERGDLWKTRLLLDHGANIHVRNDYLQEYVLRWSNMSAMGRLLLDRGIYISENNFRKQYYDPEFRRLLAIHKYTEKNHRDNEYLKPFLLFLENFGLFRRHVHTLQQLSRKRILITIDALPEKIEDVHIEKAIAAFNAFGKKTLLSY